MKNRVLRSGFLFGCLLLALATPLVRRNQRIHNLRGHAAGTGALQGTAVIGIDTAGDVAGTYIDANGAHHGFIRAANGTITTFDVTALARPRSGYRRCGDGYGRGCHGYILLRHTD